MDSKTNSVLRTLTKLAPETEGNFETRHGLKLPLNSKEELENFDLRLGTDGAFRAEWESDLQSYLDPKSVTVSATSILRKYFSKDFAGNSLVMARRVKKDSIILRQANFGQFLISFLLANEEKEGPTKASWDDISSTVGSALSHAADWGGRKRKAQADDERNVESAKKTMLPDAFSIEIQISLWTRLTKICIFRGQESLFWKIVFRAESFIF